MRGFFEILGHSWKEYKQNFSLFFVILLLFFVLPSIIKTFVSLPISIELSKLNLALEEGIKNGSFFEIMIKQSSIILNNPFFIPTAIVVILSFLLSLFAMLSILYFCLYKDEKKGLSQTLTGGAKYYFSYLIYFIVTMIFIIGLYSLFIVPGIIFSVFWIFSAYIFIKEKKGIIGSLKRSYILVRGRWWKTFGYLLSFIVVFVVVALLAGLLIGIFLFVLISFMIGIPSNLWDLGSLELSYNQMLIIALINSLPDIITTIIFLPLGALFYKNLYLDYSKDKAKNN